jgi:hypothetical protein
MNELKAILSALEIVDAMIDDGETVTARTLLLGAMARLDAEIAEPSATPRCETCIANESDIILDELEEQRVRIESTVDSSRQYEFEVDEYNFMVDHYNDEFVAELPYYTPRVFVTTASDTDNHSGYIREITVQVVLEKFENVMTPEERKIISDWCRDA